MKHIKLYESFDRELTGGEKAAISRGDEIMSEEQAAFCFVLASGDASQLMVGDSNTRFEQVASVEDWPAWVDMKTESIRRAVEKFRYLMGESEKEVTVYQKLIDFHDKFADMPREDVIELASMAIDNPTATLRDKYKKKAKFDPKDVDNAGRMIQQNMSLPFVKGNLDKAVNMYAKSKSIEPEEAKALYVEYQKRHK